MGEKIRLAFGIVATVFMASEIFTRDLVSLKVSAAFVTLYALLSTVLYYLDLRENKSTMNDK
ncbi:hypothetical protein MKY84_03130 [Chryseomicrobium sp. FSL W7-1435]|uniref:hypothetical protein n=1 Tax=Chryseomicrobium sp. FSL W7-1435 TaxID=2921704 RepID=UPI00315A17C4